ncbi:hypothetical protein ACIB24_00930 [Spongisporangium articulatum]|uniref:Uncharacterized protein n=1 Tax=Spongisporangium articulatum TaxID=3362603 RepID=A0ABW8AGZ3_9ACTN
MAVDSSYFVDHSSTALNPTLRKALENLLVAVDAAGLGDHPGLAFRVTAVQAELTRTGPASFRTRQELARLARYTARLAGDVPGLQAVASASRRLEQRCSPG